MSDQHSSHSKRPTWLRWMALVFLIIPLFPFIAYRGWRTVNAQDSDDPEDLIFEIHKMNKLSWIFRGKKPELRLGDRAKIAEQRVLQDRLKEAQQEFSAIRSELRGRTSEKAKYLRYYCNYWLANIRGDIEQSEYELRQVQKLSYQSRYLSLPEPKHQDPIDKAFDQEFMDAAVESGLTVEEYFKQQVIK